MKIARENVEDVLIAKGKNTATTFTQHWIIHKMDVNNSAFKVSSFIWTNENQVKILKIQEVEIDFE